MKDDRVPQTLADVDLTEAPQTLALIRERVANKLFYTMTRDVAVLLHLYDRAFAELQELRAAINGVEITPAKTGVQAMTEADIFQRGFARGFAEGRVGNDDPIDDIRDVFDPDISDLDTQPIDTTQEEEENR